MWKYVSRRCRDSFERSVNHFDKRSTTGVVNTTGKVGDDNKHRYEGPPCRWFASHKCWKSFQGNNGTNNKRWNFEQLNRSWIGAITWSSALVVGWYTSQIVHLKLKHHSKHRTYEKGCSLNSIVATLHPYSNNVNSTTAYVDSISKIGKIIGNFAPTVHLISNEEKDTKKGKAHGTGENESSTSPDSSDSDLADVLNSIENKLGLAAIENGQHQDGLNLLRSAANRNHAPALYNLGLCYEMGLGVSVDEKSAMELYRSAAALEHPGALYNLGIYYGQGRGGLARDTVTATRLLRLAAVQGQKDAIDALKVLDEDPVNINDDDVRSWTYGYTPFLHDLLVPSQSTLFVENVNYLQPHNAAAY